MGQLVAFANFASLTVKEGERTDAESEVLENAICDICQLPRHRFGMLMRSTMDQIVDGIAASMQTISKDVVAFSKAKNMAPTFTAIPEEWHLIEAERLNASRLKRWHLDRKYKEQVYEVVGNPERLPAQIWTRLLDNLMKRQGRVKPERFWEEWLLVPQVLACVAWGPSEKMTITNAAGELVVDMERISKMERVFLQVPAKVGLSAYGFFLATLNIYSAVNHSLNSLRK